MEYLAQLALYWQDIVGYTLIFTLSTVFFVYLFEFLERLSNRTPRSRRPQGRVSHSYRTNPKNRQLQADLLGLLQGEVSTAKRLLQYQRRMNPGKSDNWYLEKVIWDLERDRRR